MSIAAANLFTRNIYKEYLRPNATDAEEARMSRLVSLVVKVGAVVVILALDPQFSIDLQLIGGVVIVQTLPAIVIGLYSRAAHAWGLLAGWAVGLASGLYMLYDTAERGDGQGPLRRPAYALSNFGIDTDVTIYTGVIAIVINLIVTFMVSAVVRGNDLPDQTSPDDYGVEAGDPGVEELDSRTRGRSAARRRPARSSRVYHSLAEVYDCARAGGAALARGQRGGVRRGARRARAGRARARLRVRDGDARRRARAAGFDVSASDASPEMVARTRALGVRARGAPAGRQLEGGSRSTRCCASATRSRTRRDRRAALARMRRVAGATALLALTSRNWERPQPAGEEVFERDGRRATVRRTWVAGRSRTRVTLDDELYLERLAYWPFTHGCCFDDRPARRRLGARHEHVSPEADRYLVTSRANSSNASR